MTDAPASIAHLNADEFNARYPVGTAVIAYPGIRGQEPVLTTRTRTPAWTLGHTNQARAAAGAPTGEPVVSVEGHAGGIAFTHIDIAET